MPLIEANRASVVIRGREDSPLDPEAVERRILNWLENQYGYRPPVEGIEADGWGTWTVAGKTESGWHYTAVVPRHLGPARA